MASSSLRPIWRLRISSAPALVLKYHLEDASRARGIGNGKLSAPMFRIWVPSVMGTQRFIWSYLDTKDSRVALSSAGSPELRIGLADGPRILARVVSSLALAAACRAWPASAGVANVDWAEASLFAVGLELEQPAIETAARSSRAADATGIQLFFCEFIIPS